MKLTKQESNQLQEIQAYYDSDYYRNIKFKPHTISHHLRNLADKIEIKNGTKVLDVACGSGEWLMACQERGAAIYGIDISNNAIDHCKATFKPENFYVTAAESLPFEDGQFNVVTCLGSLEHFVSPEKALKEMVRVAQNNAIFILLVPNKDFLTRKLGIFSGTNQVLAKEDVKTLDEWRELFYTCGLSVAQRWKDLHILSWQWISSSHWYNVPVRAIQAIALLFWPLHWQYQVYHLCLKSEHS